MRAWRRFQNAGPDEPIGHQLGPSSSFRIFRFFLFHLSISLDRCVSVEVE
jgi:hypothetical protein